MKVRAMICCVLSSSSATPITESKVEALTISVDELTQVGRICRNAWGSST